MKNKNQFCLSQYRKYQNIVYDRDPQKTKVLSDIMTFEIVFINLFHQVPT